VSDEDHGTRVVLLSRRPGELVHERVVADNRPRYAREMIADDLLAQSLVEARREVLRTGGRERQRSLQVAPTDGGEIRPRNVLLARRVLAGRRV